MSFPRYEKYKDSGVEWLGEIPENWETRRLKTLLKEIDERAGSDVFDLLGLSKQRGVLRRRDLEQGAAESDDYGKYKTVRSGQLVMNKMQAWNGVFGISPYDGIVSPDYSVFSFVDESTDRFLTELFRTDLLAGLFRILSRGMGTAFLRLNSSDLFDVKVGLPPCDEIGKISYFLEIETAKIDALIREQQRLIELLKEKRQAVISHAVTKGLDPTVPMKDSGEGWPGQIPRHWEAKPLKHLVSISSGGTPSKSNELFWNGSIPWVSPKDMKVEVLSDSQDHITEQAVSSGGIRLLSEDHVIVVVRGMILAHSFPVAKNSVPVTINQDLKAIECGGLLDCDYFLHFLLGSEDLLVSLAAESAHGTLKLESSVLRNLLVPIPPKAEQEEIARELKRRKRTFDSLITSCESAIALLQERRSSLISAAVTGKVDVRNCASQPAPAAEELYAPA